MNITLSQVQNMPRGTTVTLLCHACGLNFTRTRAETLKSLRKGNKFSCSTQCSNRISGSGTQRFVELQCRECNEKFTRSMNDYRKNQARGATRLYCSKYCAMSALNKLHRITKTTSSHEAVITQLIKDHYDDLCVLNNVRDVLPDNLEIDIWIPSIQLAIELNGPCHFYPIYGEKRLKGTQDRDIKKSMLAQTMNINLLTIDTSSLKSKGQRQIFNFLNDKFVNNISPAIIFLMKENQ